MQVKLDRVRCWELCREHSKRAETSNDPTQSSDRFATVSPADVSNRFDACCMLDGSRKTSTPKSVGSWYWKREGKWITRRFFNEFYFFLYFLSFLCLWKIIRRISCNFINNWLKCYSLLCTKTVEKSIYFPPEKRKRENIENYRKTSDRCEADLQTIVQ